MDFQYCNRVNVNPNCIGNIAKNIPWGMLLLFAGGIAIAKAFTVSGLSNQLGNTLSGLSALPLWTLILSLCLFVTFLTEITSDTATAPNAIAYGTGKFKIKDMAREGFVLNIVIACNVTSIYNFMLC